MVIVDHNTNIDTIISTIKADPIVFDEGKTTGKLREVKYGNPENRKEEANALLPYAYVTTKESIQRSTYPYGVTANNDIPQVTVEYKISVVARSKARSSIAERSLYTLLKNLRTTLSTDSSFGGIFTRSVLNQVPWEQDTIGKLIQTVDFMLLATIGSIGTITIPGVGGGNPIQIISESPDSEIEAYSPQLNDQLLVKGFAPTGSIRSKTIEIDHIHSVTESLRTLKRTRKPFVLTTTDIGGQSTVHNALLSNLTSNIARIDNIKTDLIQFLIIP